MRKESKYTLRRGFKGTKFVSKICNFVCFLSTPWLEPYNALPRRFCLTQTKLSTIYSCNIPGPCKFAHAKAERSGNIRRNSEKRYIHLSSQVLQEIENLCEEKGELLHSLTNVRYNQSNGMLNNMHTPIIKSMPSLYPSLAPPTKTRIGLPAPSAPEEPSPAYHEVQSSWAHVPKGHPSGDTTDARDGAGSTSNESNSTSTEV